MSTVDSLIHGVLFLSILATILSPLCRPSVHYIISNPHYCSPMFASAKMLTKSSPFSLIGLYFLLFSLSCNFSIAADTISGGQSMSGNQTIVSKGGIFELGFFTPGSSQKYYIGIWYKISNQTVIWVANREAPVSDPATSQLKLTKDGNLVLLSHSKIPVWSSNSTSSLSSSRFNIAVLLDTGNLVLRGQSDSTAIIWQSFDHPTDTWLPNGWIGMNKVTGEYQSLTAWRNSEDPDPGPFTDAIDPSGINQFIFLWNNSRSYWSSGAWNGQSFSLLPGMSESTLYMYKFVDDDKRRYFSSNLSNNQILARNVMSPSGQVQQWMWFNDAQGWVLVWVQPFSPCDVFSVCGAFGICNQKRNPPCSCPDGFSPTSTKDWELGGWSSGCARNTHLQCSDKNSSTGLKDGFLAVPSVCLPVDAHHLVATSAEECEVACLNNCSCTSYAYGSRCSIWSGDIRNLQRLSDGDNNAGTLYLRLAASDLPQPISEKKSIRKVTVSAAIGITGLSIVLVLIWIFHRSRGASKSLEGPLVSFTYSDLQRCTKNFSEKLGGGGFGSVFKGVLSDSTVVAVKRLEGVRQGEKQFRSELGSLGTIQHFNLVHLRGFCCEGTERLLVYDYMPKGSLDHCLFRKESESLDWKTRYQIILGIARGLAYLHEECRECIIHCDIKPANILLDSEYCPKLSDFGMAKLLGHDFSRVLTTMRGTIGYLAPEWIEGLPITPKADVYSFGMMLFEVVSGRRNSALAEDSGIRFFPVWAASQVIVGEAHSLLDENLEGCADILEIDRVCRVACWCIQDSEVQRPLMGQVVKILEGVLDLGIPPFPRTLKYLADEDLIMRYRERSIEKCSPSIKVVSH